MTNRSPIERSISYLLLGLILIFSISSAGNTIEFIGRYHKGVAGAALGVAFGTAVFIASYIAATAHTQTTRATAIVIALGFGLASATFQMQIYKDGGANSLIAALLAFLPITLGEVGLAVLEHLFAHDAPQPATCNPQPAPIDTAPVAPQPETAPQPATCNLQPATIDDAPATTQPEIAPQPAICNPQPAPPNDVRWLYLQRRKAGEAHAELCRQLNLVPSTAASWWRRANASLQQPALSSQAAD